MRRIDIFEIGKAITFFIFVCIALLLMLTWPVVNIGGNFVDLIYWSVATSLVITIIFVLYEGNKNENFDKEI